MRIAFVGGGTMAEAMVERIIASGIATPDEVHVADVLQTRRELLNRRYSIVTHDDPRDCICEAEVVVLAFKPQDLPHVAPEMGTLEGGQLLLSILAGTKMEELSSYFRHPLIVRVMPNTPAQIGQGMTVWTATLAVSGEYMEKARAILAVLGDELYVPEEKYVDMATALSGSGPAYVSLFIEALIDGAVAIGMPRVMAQRLALQTVRGSTEFLDKSKIHPAELRNMVTSPGGTTAAALHELEKGSLRALIAQAIAAAFDRTKTSFQ